jgi:DNA-binding response OmpR family regulator
MTRSDLLACPILVVDDTNMVRVMLMRHLKQTGFSNVTECANGQEALDLLRAHRFDLVLLDINMPVLDGYGTLAAIRADDVMRQVSVIMVTAVDAIESVATCIEQGADDYMPKLFNPILLDARILSCLERRYLRRRVAELEAAFEAR